MRSLGTLLSMKDSLFRIATRRIIFSTLVALIPALTFSQNLSQHNWYFGNSNKGIRFNRADNTPSLVTNKAIPFGTGGSAVATDPATADLFFYTDGVKVFDATHQTMLNGTGLTANSSANQPVAICAVPGQTNKYFIFTNTANFTTGGTISRSVVDMGLFGNSVFPAPPLGDLENPKNVAVAGLTNRSEGMIIVPHSNGTDFWLITHQNGSTNYSATLINAASYTSGTFTTKIASGIGLPLSVANFSYFKKTKKVSVAPQSASVDASILNFDNTGTAANPFTFDRFIFNSGLPTVGNQSIYDIQWDNKGQYLYLSRTGETGIQADVLQYDYLNPNITLTSVLGTPVFRSYGLQLAPDSAIYYLYQASSGGPFLVDRFTKTDTVASSVIRTSTPFGAATDFLGTQFPRFSPRDSVHLKVSFTSSGTCQSVPVNFYPNVSPNADSLHWDFGDGSDTTLWSPIHTYAQAQTFSVTLTAYYQGQVKDTTASVTMTSFSLQLTLPTDTTACRCQLPGRRKPGETCDLPDFSVTVKVQPAGTYTYIWSNGQTGPTLKPDSAGYYYVVVSDASGCSTYAGVTVKEYGATDKRANIWYFGNKAGIDFNVSPPVALNTSAMNAPAGCAIVCDRDGEVIFYTDGDKVYNKVNTVIASGIGGDPQSAQSALIIPVPGDETLYYIFTTQAVNGTSNNELRYSLFDLKQDSGKGAVVKQDILLFSKSTERITGDDTWLIAHEYGNNTFRAYQISKGGIADPVYSAIGSDHSFEIAQNGQGYMKLGAKNRLAVALSSPGSSNLVELFDFSNTTGKVTNYRKIDLKTPNGQVYGIEISPGGNKLFATVDGLPAPSELFEYSIDSLGQTHLKQELSEPAELGALQLGPDGQIYVAQNDAGHDNSVGRIAPDDDTTKLSTFNLSGFALKAGTNSRLGLPNFRQQITIGGGGPGFTFSGTCVGDSTHFVGTPTDPIDKFQWFFGDGGSSTLASPVHLYAAAGTYTVSMHLTNRCHLDTTLVQQITIFPPPPSPTVPAASYLCHGPVTLDANTGGLSGTTYLWTTGDTTRKITLNQNAVVSVTNTDKNGCTSTAQAVVVNNRPQVQLGPDQTVCQNTSVPILDAQNPGATYVWTVNGVNTSTIETQAVDTTVPGKFEYDVAVTDPITTCTVSDSVGFTINVSPSFTLSATNSACGSATGSIQVQLNASTPAGGPYSYFLTGPNGFNQQGIDQVAPTTIGPIGGQKA
jgi:PKD repeat protein